MILPSKPTFLLLLFLLATAGPLSANAATFAISGGGGLDVATACPTPAGSVCTPGDLTLESPVPVSGFIDLSLDPGTFGAGTADISITTLGDVSMIGLANGVEQIVFTAATYSITGLPVLSSDFFGVSTQYIIAPGTLPASLAGMVSVTYEQYAGAGPTLVAGPTTVAAIPAQLLNLDCLLGAVGGTCGIRFGPADFTLGVGATGSQIDYDFNHTFNVAVNVPEPAGVTMLVLGFGLALLRRR